MAARYPPSAASFYPEVDQKRTGIPNDSTTPSKFYPTIDMSDLAENLFQESDHSPSAPYLVEDTVQETLIRIPSVILNLIDGAYSAELASGEFSIVCLRQGGNIVAVFARVSDEIQWPLARDEAVVKLDSSHYFFSLQPPPGGSHSGSDSSDEEKKGKGAIRKHTVDHSGDVLNYGLTIPSSQDEKLSKELDAILEAYSCFSVHKVSVSEKDIINVGIASGDLVSQKQSLAKGKGKEKAGKEGQCVAYWTTLAPNVEDYSGQAAKLIASGSGQLIKGILWCGDVTIDQMKMGNEVMKKRMSSKPDSEISPETLKRIRRVKRMTKMTNKVANGVLSGVIKVSGFLTSSAVNSKVGKKFFSLVPGEIVLASLDGFNKVCDALEVAGKNVMSTSSTVTTELVTRRYGESAGKATNEGLDAAGHAIGTAWAVFKIRKALNPKNSVKPTTLVKSAAQAAAAQAKGKKSK